MLCCFDLFCYSTAPRVEFYIKRLPLAIQCLLSGYECRSRRLPKTDYFSVSLTVQVVEWNQALSLCFSSRFPYTSKLLCRRLRYKAEKVELLWLKVGGKYPRSTNVALSSLSNSPSPPHLRRNSSISKESSLFRVWDYLIFNFLSLLIWLFLESILDNNVSKPLYLIIYSDD